MLTRARQTFCWTWITHPKMSCVKCGWWKTNRSEHKCHSSWFHLVSDSDFRLLSHMIPNTIATTVQTKNTNVFSNIKLDGRWRRIIDFIIKQKYSQYQYHYKKPFFELMWIWGSRVLTFFWYKINIVPILHAKKIISKEIQLQKNWHSWSGCITIGHCSHNRVFG